MRRHHSTVPDSEWLPAEAFQNLTAEKIAALPDRAISGLLKFHTRHHAAQARVAEVALICAEARRRGPERIWCWYALQMLDPSKCACGGPGHYVVGPTTYCGKPACQRRARQAMQPRGVRQESVSRSYADIAADREARLRARDSLRNCDPRHTSLARHGRSR